MSLADKSLVSEGLVTFIFLQNYQPKYSTVLESEFQNFHNHRINHMFLVILQTTQQSITTQN